MVMWAMMLLPNPGAGAGASGKEKGRLDGDGPFALVVMALLGYVLGRKPLI